MNLSLATTELALALGDPTNGTYSANALQSALLRSVRAYSQYRPCLRRIGTSTLVLPVTAPTATLYVTGGVLVIGNVLTLDAGSPNAETVTILRLANDNDGAQPTAYTTLTLTTSTAKTHLAGALILPVTPGLNVTAGIDTCLLPADFVRPEQSTFDMAVGAKLSYRKGDGYYDASYLISNQLSGTGFGRAANWGPMSSVAYPLVGNPLDNPNSGINQPGQAAFRFYLSDTPSLRIIPSPNTAYVLDFDYYGCQTIASVPSADQEIIMLYACYAAATAQAQVMNSVDGGDVKIEEYEQSVSRNALALLKLAESKYKMWEDKLRFAPYGTSG
jgi:hypothetical protein